MSLQISAPVPQPSWVIFIAQTIIHPILLICRSILLAIQIEKTIFVRIENSAAKLISRIYMEAPQLFCKTESFEILAVCLSHWSHSQQNSFVCLPDLFGMDRQ